jgi:hypothetical protein
MFSFSIGRYTLLALPDRLPDLYQEYRTRASLLEEFNLSASEGKSCFLAVQRGHDWPFLVVAQRYWPAEGGFHPEALLIPETDLLFIGAGERLLAYRLTPPARLWGDHADAGFWFWQRHADHVLMSAELELAAWDKRGVKLWTTFVEPPWDYAVKDGVVHLDVVGQKSAFPLASGPR